MALLLDTTVLVDALRGAEAVARRLSALTEPPLVSAISVEEIVRGMRPHEQEATQLLLSGAVIVPVGEPEARLAGNWRRDYAARGVTLSQADALIAASAVLRAAPVATANVRDFPMDEVTVEHWPATE